MVMWESVCSFKSRFRVGNVLVRMNSLGIVRHYLSQAKVEQHMQRAACLKGSLAFNMWTQDTRRPQFIPMNVGCLLA